MNHLAVILLFSWLAGAAAFVGGVLAKMEGSPETEGKRELIHAIVAFGGGILVAAVAFSLAPEGMETLSPPVLAGTFSLGGIVFCSLDAFLDKRGGSKAQFMAMIMDFVPEAIALGALSAKNQSAAILLAVYIGAQNLPEGFNSFREFMKNRIPARKTLWFFGIISLLGPVAACCGYFLLRQKPILTAGIMSFAGGGILYLVFQDIAPQSKMRRHWTPTLGAVLGFLVGMIGKQLLG